MAFPHKSQKIAETIAGWFEEQRYRPGDRFPSDQELARQFGVNHVTVRTALKRFVEPGWLERKVGAGTVVRDPKSRREAERGRQPGGGHRHPRRHPLVLQRAAAGGGRGPARHRPSADARATPGSWPSARSRW